MGTKAFNGDIKTMNQNEFNQTIADIKKSLEALESTGAPAATITEETAKHPDARWHLRVSLAKSIIRILAGSVLCMGEFFLAGSLLVLAELLGVVEELV